LNARVSVVIATYKRVDDLKECLNSIFGLSTPPYEIIVVDSNSRDGTEELGNLFAIKYASIRDRNRQRARNLGISMARGEIVAFLDDDVIVDANWLNQIATSYTDIEVGGVGGRVLPVGSHKGSYVKTAQSDIGKVSIDGLVVGNFDLPAKNAIRVDSFIGCNMSFRRALLVKEGGFDEKYVGSGYRDDTDLCMRIRRRGYWLVYNPKALVWHKYRGKKISRDWSYWYVRNNVYFYLKNLFPQYRLRLPIFLYSLFMPPRDYVLKSGIRMKIEPSVLINVLKGFRDGHRTWRSQRAQGK
jgi:glycogen(starch) synthase